MNRGCALSGLLSLLAGLLLTAAGCGPARILPRFSSDTVVRSAEPPSPAPDPVAYDPATPPRPPRNILALSGGGSYGAYTAGVLTGWSRADTRPDFDVVTGISTGALIAPIAFLGPKYDFELRKFYTEVGPADIFSYRSWYTLPFRDAFASSAPLRKTVESGLTTEVVHGIAVEHLKGRRLYIATTQLDTSKTVVWDIGAIAHRGGPNARRLICDLMIASSSVPGVLPPVPVIVDVDGKKRVELHVDGGVTATVFVPSDVIEAAARTVTEAGGPANVYVIVAGKAYPEPTKVRARLIGVLEASGAAFLSAHTRRDVGNLYHMTRLAGLNFHLATLRQDFPQDGGGSALDFDPNAMGPLYVEGIKVGVAGPAWDTEVPERSPGTTGTIRTGPRLRTPPGN